MSSSLRPAITNWLWLAELRATEDALVIGEYPLFVRAGLERHFSSITHQPLVTKEMPGAGIPDLSIAYEGDSFDCAVLDEDVSRMVADSSSESSSVLLHKVRHVLRLGGCAFIGFSRMERGAGRQIVRRLKKTGFRRVRMLYVYESLEHPNTLVPASRGAAAYFELFAWGGVRGLVRAIIAAVGLHHLLHRSAVVLAYR